MLRTSSDPYSDLLNLRRNEIAVLLTQLTPSNNHLRPHLEMVASTGEPAIAIVEALLEEYPSSSGHQALHALDSDCAGLFLLVRTVQDLRLSALLRDSGFASLEPLLIALAIRIAGPLAVKDNKLDLGAALWAGISSEEFSSHLQRLATLDAQLFHTNLSDLLEARRLVDPISSEDFSDQLPSDFLPSEVAPAIDFAAASLLRSWARWLPGLGDSSVPFLLEKFVRRSGQLHLYPDCIEVCFLPGPLDAILKMAGYLSDTPIASWLGNRFVRFRIAS